eukprot:TRINITY_DN18763_c0_g1_i1.p1 TRINITY_DN18763_c0_g1~~TRINITY_DN18763_c0_g1_i1.p1  ORF type:complete len:508 (-),score=70.17 TRINITY_DN18763_c0_g1_i1:97-1620(-)
MRDSLLDKPQQHEEDGCIQSVEHHLDRCIGRMNSAADVISYGFCGGLARIPMLRKLPSLVGSTCKLLGTCIAILVVIFMCVDFAWSTAAFVGFGLGVVPGGHIAASAAGSNHSRMGILRSVAGNISHISESPVLDLATLVKTAYCPVEDTRDRLQHWGRDEAILAVDEFRTPMPNEKGENVARTVVRKHDCVVMFRGTGEENMKDNFFAWSTPATHFCGPIGGYFCSAHYGAYHAWFGFFRHHGHKTLRDQVVAFLDRQECREKQHIYVTGHSLGSSIGTIATIDLVKNHGFDNILGVLFAPYPVLGPNTAHLIEAEMGDKIIRVNHANDGVPHLLAFPGYFGLGNRHVGMEIFYSDPHLLVTPPVLISTPEHCTSLFKFFDVFGMSSKCRGSAQFTDWRRWDYGKDTSSVHCANPPLYTASLNSGVPHSRATICDCPHMSTANNAAALHLEDLDQLTEERLETNEDRLQELSDVTKSGAPALQRSIKNLQRIDDLLRQAKSDYFLT